jgi:glucose repression regulatory protein TUP1
MIQMYSSGRIQPQPTQTSRFSELLEAMKVEYDNLAHEVSLYKIQREEADRKLQAQVQELTSIQQTMYDLDRSFQKMKQQYEDDIFKLRRQIEMQGGTAERTHIHPNPGGSSSFTPIPRANPTPPVMPAPQPLTSPIRNTTPTTDKSGAFNSALLSGNSTAVVEGQGKKTPKAESKRSTKRTREAEQHIMPANPNPSYSGNNNNNITVADSTQPLKQIKTSPEEERKPSNLNSKDIHEERKAEDSTSDWIVGINPGVPTDLHIDLLHNLEHTSVVCYVKFSNDGKHLATGCNKSAQIFDVETGEKVHIFSEEAAKDGDLYIRSVCFSPDDRFLATGAEDKTVKIWDIKEKRLKQTFVGHELDIYSLDYSRCGNFIVSGSGDKRTRIWDVEKGECLFVLGNDEVGPKDGVTSVAFSPDGRFVAAGSLDRIVRVWDAETGNFMDRYEGHADSVYAVAFSPDGKSLASGSLDKTLKLWDLSNNRNRARCRSTFSGHKDFVLSVAFSADGNWLISGSKDRSVQFWDPRNAVTHMMLQGHKNSVISVAVSPTGGVFATGSGDFRARCWKYY